MEKIVPTDPTYTGYEVPPGFAKLLSPKIDPEKDPLFDATLHLAAGDLLLRVILDVAERGRQHSADAGHLEAEDRFNMITDLLNLYRSGIDALDERLAKVRGGKAA